MSIAMGKEPTLGVGIETTPGTAVAATKYLPFVTCNIKGTQEPIADESAKGIREKNWGAIVGAKKGEGDIEVYVDVENAAYLIYPALGACSSATASGESDVYEHTITRKASNPPKTLTIIYNDTQDTRKYAYATINTLELNVTDGIATISANFLSKFPASGTGTQAITEERILAFKDYTIKLGSGANGTAALSAASSANATPVRNFTLRINNNAEVQHLSGDNDIAQVSIGELEVDGEYTLFYENTTERDFYETMLSSGDAVRAMIVTFSGNSIGNAETEEIQIKIPNFHVRERGFDSGVSGFITENPTFVAEYDPTETKSIEIVITNEQTSY